MTDATPENYEALHSELNNRMKVENAFKVAFPAHTEALKARTTPSPVTDADFECYENLINEFEAVCGRSEYALKFYGAFVAECKAIQAYPAALDDTGRRIREACTQPIA